MVLAGHGFLFCRSSPSTWKSWACHAMFLPRQGGGRRDKCGPFLFHAVPPLGLACLISLSRFFSRFETVKLAVMIPVTWSLASKPASDASREEQEHFGARCFRSDCLVWQLLRSPARTEVGLMYACSLLFFPMFVLSTWVVFHLGRAVASQVWQSGSIPGAQSLWKIHLLLVVSLYTGFSLMAALKKLAQQAGAVSRCAVLSEALSSGSQG